MEKRTIKLLEKAKLLFGKQVDALVRQEEKVRELLVNVGKKINQAGQNQYVKRLIEPVSVFIRMVKSHLNGEHKLSGSTLGLIILGLVYFVSPIDIIPDFLGFFGFADDFSVILAIYAKVKEEVGDFLDWERTQSK
ncbi:MAG: uncharacterized membrane protein YkvA (DUF1232 family) [Algoriphagus sp.]|jgi:uncharacterized membrane protein YkvA (DUF1232 family)|tara:strand:+ start:639 stop:1046 length:408 start_codon:yes stop_codon:yes gene_type:complete